MNALKRYLGIVWIVMGPAVFLMLILSAFKHINSNVKGDISNPVPWIIIIVIFLPIAIGLVIFGRYCWQGAYDTKEE
jgi:hypothetical protein